MLVPFTGSWHPLAVAWGIVGMYLLVAIEITSLLRHRMSKRAWHAVHLLSYFLFATTTRPHAHRRHRREGAGRVERRRAPRCRGGLRERGPLPVAQRTCARRAEPGNPATCRPSPTAGPFALLSRPPARSGPRPRGGSLSRRRAARRDGPAPRGTTARQPSMPTPTNTRVTIVNAMLRSRPSTTIRSEHPDDDGHPPRDGGATPRERRPREAGDRPGDREPDDERPPDPQEPDDPGVLVVAAPSDHHEQHQHREVGRGGDPRSDGVCRVIAHADSLAGGLDGGPIVCG